VKLLKFIETSRCLSVSSNVYGIISNAVKVPVCFRNVPGKILQPCRFAFIQVKPCGYIPDCHDMERKPWVEESLG